MRAQSRVQVWLVSGIALAVLAGIGWFFVTALNRKPNPAQPQLEAAKALVDPPAVAKADTEKTAPSVGSELAKTDTEKPVRPTRNPRPADDGKPRLWSIVVGIDAYLDIDGIPTCQGAEYAAQAFAGWLKNEAGWDGSSTLLLTGKGAKTHLPANEESRPLFASREHLNWAFKEWLPARIRPGDTVVFFYSGQAVGLPAPQGSPKGTAGRGLLLTIDARASSADLTGWSLGDAVDEIAKTGKNPVVCFLDTSLYGRGAAVKSPQVVGKPDSLGFLRSVTRWPGVTAWIASTDKPAIQAKAVGELSPFADTLIESFGRRDDPYNLLASLSRLQRDPRTVSQGFRAVGGVGVDLTLWSSNLKYGEPKAAELLVQRGHARSVDSIAFQSDGGLLVTGAKDSTVRIWRVSDRTLLRVLDPHLLGVTSLAIADSGYYLASGDANANVQVWDFRRRVLITKSVLPSHQSGLTNLAFIPESSRLLSRDRSGLCVLTNLADLGRPPKRIAIASQAMACATVAGPIAFALADVDGKVARFGRDGLPQPIPLDGPGGKIDSNMMATDGTRLVCGDREGRLVVWDESLGRVLERKQVAPSIDLVAVRGDRVVVASDRTLLIFSIKDNVVAAPASLAVPHLIEKITISEDGSLVAVRTKNSTMHLWKVEGSGAPQPLTIQGDVGEVSSIAIAPNGKTLAAGIVDGGVRFWNLENDGEALPAVAARRGQVESVSVSGEGRFLLQVNSDHVAQVWDLFEARELTVIPPPQTLGVAIPEGWQSGAITKDGKNLVLTTYPRGDIIVVDRETGRYRELIGPGANPFERPTNADDEKAPFNGTFKVVTLSESPRGPLVAASSGSIVCVWNFITGSLVHTIRAHDDPVGIVRAIDFTTDGKTLLTAGEDGAVFLWNLERPDPKNPKQPERLAAFALTKENNQATAACFLPSTDPKAPLEVAVGAQDGEVSVWRVGKAQPLSRLVTSGPEVTSLVLSADRKWMAASTADKSLRHWKVSPSILSQGMIEPSPNHDERVNALAAWPGRPVIVSGSDDTTLRLWNLETKKLLGTLSAGDGTSDWVAFAPNGRFDCAVGAERQLTWLQNNEVLPVEQFGETLRIQGLLGLLSKGEAIPAHVFSAVEQPRLAIDPPPALKAVTADAELVVSLSAASLTDLRLYQDGVPIRESSDFQLAADGKRGTIKVKLHNGINRFYAMGSLPGSIDGRSNDVELRYDAPDPPSQLHILALGVGEYTRLDRKLKYAKKDAVEFADFLQKKGIQGSKGLTIVLKDTEVNEKSVTEGLEQIRNRVRDHPQDTVAVFLAGHTDVIGKRFCLLLPAFPFPDQPGVQQFDFKSIVGFDRIYQYVAYLGCRNRLMIVDACRSGEILNDKGVQWVRRELDSEAHRGRTAYILAARPGAVAGEADVLEHGLLTYSLLKGLGAPNLKPVTVTDIFKQFPSADRDHNKVVTADELRWYADMTVPKLAKDIPLLVQRSGVSRTSSPPLKPINGGKSSSEPEPPTPDAIPLVNLP